MNKTIARRVIKANSMQNMQGNWLRSFALIMLNTIITIFIMSLLPVRIPLQEELIAAEGNYREMMMLFVPENITVKTLASVAVTFLLYLFVICPFSTGVCRFYLKVARGEKGTFGDVFSAFTNIHTVFASIWLNVIILFIGAFLGIFVMLIPVLVLQLSIMVDSRIMFYAAMALAIVAAIFFALWMSRYNFAAYIFADRGRGAFSAVRDCVRLLFGRNGEAIALRASYFGWDIAGYLLPALSPAISFIYTALFSAVYAKYIYYFTGQMSIGEPNMPPEI